MESSFLRLISQLFLQTAFEYDHNEDTYNYEELFFCLVGDGFQYSENLGEE